MGIQEILQALIALASIMPTLWTKIEEIINSIKATLSEDDKANLEIELAALRARMPQIQADTDAALDRAAGS